MDDFKYLDPDFKFVVIIVTGQYNDTYQIDQFKYLFDEYKEKVGLRSSMNIIGLGQSFNSSMLYKLA